MKKVYTKEEIAKAQMQVSFTLKKEDNRIPVTVKLKPETVYRFKVLAGLEAKPFNVLLASILEENIKEWEGSITIPPSFYEAQNTES